MFYANVILKENYIVKMMIRNPIQVTINFMLLKDKGFLYVCAKDYFIKWILYVFCEVILKEYYFKRSIKTKYMEEKFPYSNFKDNIFLGNIFLSM